MAQQWISLRPGLVGIVVTIVMLCGLLAAPGYSATEETITELRALVDESRYEEAIELARTTVEALQASGGGDAADEAAVLECWVEALYRSGRAVEPQTLELAERAVALRREASPVDTEGTVASLLHLGNLYFYRSQPDSARAQYSRALELLEQDPDPNEAQLALTLNNLGVSWKLSGDYARAVQYYEWALARREELLGPDHPDVAASLNNLANVSIILGDYERARLANERALAIRENYYGPDNEWVAESLNNLSSVLSYEGKYEEALAAQERAVAVFGSTLGEDHERYWTARLNLAAVYFDLGDHLGALQIFEDVLEWQRRHFGPEHIHTVEALDSVAEVLVSLGDFARAEELLELSLQISTRAHGEGGGGSAYTLQILGECLAEAGRYAEAAERFEEALHLWEADLGPETPELSELMHWVAEVKLAQGEFDTAAELAQRSAAYIEAGLGPDHPLLAQALRIDALTAREVGDFDRALDSALRAEDISRRHATATIRVLSDSHALDMAMSRTFGLDLALSLLAHEEQSERTTRVYDALIRSRALLFDELASRHRSYDQADDGSIDELVENMRAARTRLANLTIRGPGWEEVTAYRLMLEDARNEKAFAERELAKASRRYRAEQAAHSTGLTELRTALPGGALVISYVRYAPTDADAEERYAAFVMTAGEEQPRFVDLGPADAVNAVIAEWRQQAAWGATSVEDSPTRGLVRRSREAGAQETAYDEVATRVWQTVWDPVTPQESDAAQVFLVPDGNLHLLNLYALKSDDGRFLVESGPAIRRLPTERSLNATLASVPPGNGTPNALLVGDPDYGTPPGASATDSTVTPELVFDPLPGALREVDRLDQAWQLRYPGEDSPLVLSEANATESAFKRSVHERTVLHLATHGYVLSGESETGSGDPASTARSNPLLRTGLAFAGANERTGDQVRGDDGILTAEELAALDLSHADWAVLSACGTGLGEIKGRGEGVFGLARAFQIAGARTVIMSLWEVDDQATLDWMLALYEGRLEQDLSTCDSVRQASVRTIQARRAAGQSDHPFYWAAFVSTGDWR